MRFPPQDASGRAASVEAGPAARVGARVGDGHEDSKGLLILVLLEVAARSVDVDSRLVVREGQLEPVRQLRGSAELEDGGSGVRKLPLKQADVFLVEFPTVNGSVQCIIIYLTG